MEPEVEGPSVLVHGSEITAYEARLHDFLGQVVRTRVRLVLP